MVSIPKPEKIDVADFPAISSLDFVRQVLENIDLQLTAIDKEVARASKGDAAYVKALYECIHEIKSRAEQADMILTDVMSDSAKLEATVSKIDGSCETFDNLKKLIASIQELQKEMKEGEYDYFRVVADLLVEVHEQVVEFEPHAATPHVALVKRHIEACETELRRQITWVFREIGQLMPSDRADFGPPASSSSSSKRAGADRNHDDDDGDDHNGHHDNDGDDNDGGGGDDDNNDGGGRGGGVNYRSRTAAAGDAGGGSIHGSIGTVDVSAIVQVSLVVDALGLAFRKDVLERFSQLQLIPYEKLFHPGSEYADLDKLETRFDWFKQLLRVVGRNMASVFPVSWHVFVPLFWEFSRRTREHIKALLAATESESIRDPKGRVGFLLMLLKNIISFETEIKNSFNAKIQSDTGEESSFDITVSICEAFDNFLGPYVQLERQGLEELMDLVTKSEMSPNPHPAGQGSADGGPAAAAAAAAAPVPHGPPPTEPFESSRKMFEYIKGSLKRCTGFSTGITFLSLSKEFRVCLQHYAEKLKFRCPSPLPTKPGKALVYSITLSMEKFLCKIINTAEYCISTVPALEAMMKQRINDTFRDQIDFNPQLDCFADTISFTIGVLSSGEVHRMEPDFDAMRKVAWSTLEEVGDVGSYAKHMLKILGDCVPRIRLVLSAAYFQNVCQRLATTFLDAFLDNIWKLKRICKTGGGQLLMDLNGLKEYLLQMPNYRLPEGKEPVAISKVYTTLVTAKTKKIEVVLKLVCTEDSMMEEMFSLLWPDGTAADLEQVSALKSSNRILPINSPALDTVTDNIKDVTKAIGGVVGTSKVGKISKDAMGDLKSNFSMLGGGFKHAMGEMFSGSLFSSDEDAPAPSPSAGSSGSAGAGARPMSQPQQRPNGAPQRPPGGPVTGAGAGAPPNGNGAAGNRGLGPAGVASKPPSPAATPQRPPPPPSFAQQQSQSGGSTPQPSPTQQQKQQQPQVQPQPGRGPANPFRK